MISSGDRTKMLLTYVFVKFLNSIKKIKVIGLDWTHNTLHFFRLM